ncbi:putative amidophosphoribosyltransferase [Enterococcus rotai]|uniref:Uncharacterized protein n=1 Tax=Enterococcus rotai TaxID=118060 RepID=A0A0U2NMV4_9ENTE|nr:hypothetical protein ATZ35_01830 [Enterococcus rotai]
MKRCLKCENIINEASTYCNNCEKQLTTIPSSELKNEPENSPFAMGLPDWDVVPPETVVVRRKRKR